MKKRKSSSTKVLPTLIGALLSGALYALVNILPMDGAELFAQTRNVILGSTSDSRKEPELTICSQNLNNFGALPDMLKRFKSYSKKQRDKKVAGLLQRFLRAKCDVIAMQEVIGQRQERYENAVRELATLLQRKTGRSYSWVLGTGTDKYSRVGYLIAKDRAKLLHTVSYSRVELPRINKYDRPRKYLRAPLEVQLQVLPIHGSAPRVVRLINIHFKSKHGGSRDPAKLDWEITRMEMGEALRRILEFRHKDALSSAETPVIVMGDRNSFHDSASSLILNGVLTLEDFKKEGSCRVSSLGMPLCKGNTGKPQKIFSVLVRDPETKLQGGTHVYRGKKNWIDDILIDSSSLFFAREKTHVVGNYSSGVIFEPRGASDHALSWVALNW